MYNCSPRALHLLLVMRFFAITQRFSSWRPLEARPPSGPWAPFGLYFGLWKISVTLSRTSCCNKLEVYCIFTDEHMWKQFYASASAFYHKGTLSCSCIVEEQVASYKNSTLRRYRIRNCWLFLGTGFRFKFSHLLAWQASRELRTLGSTNCSLKQHPSVCSPFITYRTAVQVPVYFLPRVIIYQRRCRMANHH